MILSRTISYILRSIFQKDRPAVALYIIAKNGIDCTEWRGGKWDIFVGNLKSLNIKDVPSWLPMDKKGAMATLLEHCPEVMQIIDFENEEWIQWFKGRKVEFPISSLSAVDRILLIQAFRREQLITTIEKYCCKYLGFDSLTPTTLNINTFWNEIKESESSVMILTQSSYPNKELENFMQNKIGYFR